MPRQYLIDVRSPAEFAEGALAGASNIEYTRIHEMAADDVRLDDDILLYCRSGRRSALARDTLLALGYRGARDIGTLEQAAAYLAANANGGSSSSSSSHGLDSGGGDGGIGKTSQQQDDTLAMDMTGHGARSSQLSSSPPPPREVSLEESFDALLAGLQATTTTTADEAV